MRLLGVAIGISVIASAMNNPVMGLKIALVCAVVWVVSVCRLPQTAWGMFVYIADNLRDQYATSQKIRYHPMFAEILELRRAISKLQKLARSDKHAQAELDRAQELYENILRSEIAPGSPIERSVDKRVQKNRSAIDEAEAEFQFMQDQGSLRRERE